MPEREDEMGRDAESRALRSDGKPEKIKAIKLTPKEKERLRALGYMR